MKKTKSRVLLAVLLAVCVLSFALAWLPFGKRTAYAAEGDSLYSISNTYDATITQKTEMIKGKAYTYDFATYDLTVKRQNVTVSSDVPQVTFITHGLGASALCWSNGGLKKGASSPATIVYTESSIIESLKQKADCNVYIADFDSSNIDTIQKTVSFEYRLTMINDDYSQTEDFSGDKNIKNKIIDNTKHSVVLFQAYEPDGSNDFIYAQFNYMASRIVNDLRELDKDHALPRVNLIGHSRGGLTNLQYALDHPDLVESVFSIGTPYVGSTMAEVETLLLNNAIQGQKEGKDDIVNYDVYMDYMNRWNNNYDRIYKNIKVYALGAYESLDMLIYELLYNILPDNFFLDGTVKIALNAINHYLSYEFMIKDGIESIGMAAEVAGMTIDVIEKYFPTLANQNNIIGGLRAALSLLFQEVQFNPILCTYEFLNDGAVDLASQLGKEGNTGRGYKGFTNIIKRFNIFTSANLERCYSTDLRVTHNLETMDIELLNWIVQDINISGNQSGSQYLYTIKDDGTLRISGYIGTGEGEILSIPSAIAVKDMGVLSVTEIGECAFSNNINDRSGIKHIIIPKSIKTIKAGAFYNNEYIDQITIEGSASNESALTEISSQAFSWIPNLKSFIIGDKINIIEEDAFYGSGINSITSYSPNYSWQNNFLINNNVSNLSNKIAFYANPESQASFVPNDVGVLSANLFYGNKNIREINLNHVESIGAGAFSYSGLTILNQTENITDVDLYSFLETPWIKNQSGEFITIGKVLLSYNGTDQNIILPNNIERISGNAFKSQKLNSVVLPATLETIGYGAFVFCDNIDWILIDSPHPPTLDGQCFSAKTKLYVRSSSLPLFLNSVFYRDLSNIIETKKVQVSFYDINNQYLGKTEEEYYSNFDQFIQAPSITGKDFICWNDEKGSAIFANDIFNYYEDVKLKAIYEPSKYIIHVTGHGDQSVTYGDTISFGCPSELGRNFLGWYDDEDRQITDSTGTCVWRYDYNIKYIAPKFKAIIYNIDYINYTFSEGLNGLPRTFTVDSPVTSASITAPKRFGFIFDGWLLKDGREFVSTRGIYENITLEEKWRGDVIEGKSTTITNKYAIIDMMQSNANSSYVYIIGSNVRYATFYGNPNVTFSNMRIVVNSRSTALVLGFKDMNFHPEVSNGVGYDAISAKSRFELYITYYGVNNITGGRGADGISYYGVKSQATNNQAGSNGYNGGNGYAGGCGINAWIVKLQENDSKSKINIFGGNGGDGGKGQDGQAGSNGVKGPSGWFFHPVKGDNGSNGGKGGNGGDGGIGGYAICVGSDLKVSKTGIFKLTGGSGGNGGLGGNGGNGGNGASDTSVNPFNGVGDPGDGGNGGNGGNGGKGASGSNAHNCIGVKGKGGSSGDAGYAGSGGSAGQGGDAGMVGNNGGNGSSGNKGEGKNGASGSHGTVDSFSTDIKLTTNYVELPYLYDESAMSSLTNWV